MKVLIVGGGKKIYFLTQNLISKGFNVTIVNKNRDECEYLAENLKATIIFGNGSNDDVLSDAKIYTMDTVFALTPNDEDNLLICRIAKLKYGITRCFSIVNDPALNTLFEKFKIRVISITELFSNLLEQNIDFTNISNFTYLGGGNMIVSEVDLPETSIACGKSLKEITLPNNTLVISIERDGVFFIPSGKSVLKKDDKLYILGKTDKYKDIAKLFQ